MIEERLQTVNLALELLTGICATLPDPEPLTEAEQNDEPVEEDDENEDWQGWSALPRCALLSPTLLLRR